jgi:predicted alpha/beta-fold hydrolase
MHRLISSVIFPGSNESYLRSILVVACASKEEGGLGYRGVVVNCRGCKLKTSAFLRDKTEELLHI